ncbi:tubulin binding cofactor C-domain-containing protein [Zychaea mexicana]|uniref:tubulin binding cofactor C-domain-containing protein n=1 Tax=Zychaea mexicana TaxID=64656 RepID=UPI0022FDEB27|nr:tubulin binding cofactor C-domain-containing protein [Zychaea mexicana]KAI9498484.1 tubulin binding cofactor C-domain-containing protein [Zychaea mexicana]
MTSSEPSATEAANTFWHEFKAERSAIENAIQRSAHISKTKLADHFQTILQSINNLEKRLTQATEYIPSYDERQYARQIKELSRALEAARANLTPKPKFTFKSRKQQTHKMPQSAPASYATTALAAIVNNNDTIQSRDYYEDDNVVSYSDMSDQLIEPTSLENVDVLLSNLTRCTIILTVGQVSALHIKNLSQCVVVCKAIRGSVLMYGFTRSVIAVGCHQFRMHDARSVHVLLNVSSRPIIEDSSDISVGSYSHESLNIPDVRPEYLKINCYDQMEDFNWLKKQASPNWRVMDSAEADQFNQSITHDPPTQLSRLLCN